MGIMNFSKAEKQLSASKQPLLVLGDSGQMTVEFMVTLPVLLIVAVIATNALLFFSECAAFDRMARDAVRIYACSPTYAQSSEQSCSQIKEVLQASFENEYLECEVTFSSASMGHTTYISTLIFHPTLFSMGLRSEVLGIKLPQFKHFVELSVDTYKPGVLI